MHDKQAAAPHKLSGTRHQGRPLLLIGNPGNKRTAGLQQARAALGLAPAIEVPYLNVLKQLEAGRHFDEIVRAALPADAEEAPLLRLDAPGEQPEVERELIAWGDNQIGFSDALLPFVELYGSGASLSAAAARRLDPARGELLYPAQWFRGYCCLLARLEQDVREALPQAQWLNAPADIAAMFDKRLCQQRLAAQGVPVPPRLARPGEVNSYEQLHHHVQHTGMHRLFLKLAHGSGASGIIAYQRHPRTGAEQVTTTIGVERSARRTYMYNSGKLRRYSDQALIKPIIDWLCAEGVHIEQWIAKAAHDGQAFDIRQLVAGGMAGHAVARRSKSPITNLHLRNERLPLADLNLPEPVLHHVKQTACSAAAAFPDSFAAGIDVLLRSGSLSAYVVDVNPFGDLLYHVDYEGLSTYEWEMKLLDEQNRTEGEATKGA
ncbi:hypothetical protein EBB07_25040 [Paenibacillaceae bacterium]|nr:hypothetical protein EBB07_25040 [Paenibacillaceae bacterium]